MSEAVNRQFLIAARPSGMVKESDFEYREAPIPEPGDGEVLVRTLLVSVDPAMRGHMLNRANYAGALQIGDVMRARAVGQVAASNHPDFAVGDKVSGELGFQEYLLAGGDPMPITKLPEGADLEAASSVLGIPGLSAYYGMLAIGEPKEGDEVLVSGAAGAVGTIAGQLAKIHGARVVGIAGSDEKCRMITAELGFDAAINYRTENVTARVRELFPKGIDIFFDNVAGEALEAALENIRLNARVVLCGGISHYNDDGPVYGPKNYFNLVMQRAKMEGFIVGDRAADFPAWRAAMAGWMAEGRLKYKLDIVEGFENLPKALIGLFTGENTGKRVVRIADPD